MDKRRIAALELIEQIRQHEMEDEVRELGQINGRIDALEEERRELSERLTREAHIVSIEAAPYVGSFIRTIRAEIAAKETEIAQLSRKAEKLEAVVREKYREVKTFSIILSQTRSTLRQEREKREGAQAEEQALLHWNRLPG